MKRTAAQQKTIDDAASALETAREVLATEVERYNGNRSAHYEALQGAIETYNEACETDRSELQAFVENYNERVADLTAALADVQSDLESTISERSEKWQEGDAGQAATAFAEAHGIDVPEYEVDDHEAVSIDEPDEIEPPDEADLSDLPDES